MNTDNLNKSQVIEMMCRIEDIRDKRLQGKTIFERYSRNYGAYGYLWFMQLRLNNILHAFGHDYTLCAYCCNSLDHNLGDHKLAIERQRVTNQDKLWDSILEFHESLK